MYLLIHVYVLLAASVNTHLVAPGGSNTLTMVCPYNMVRPSNVIYDLAVALGDPLNHV